MSCFKEPKARRRWRIWTTETNRRRGGGYAPRRVARPLNGSTQHTKGLSRYKEGILRLARIGSVFGFMRFEEQKGIQKMPAKYELIAPVFA